MAGPLWVRRGSRHRYQVVEDDPRRIRLLTQAFEQATERLRAKGYPDPWPDDLQAREVVRFLRERSQEVIARMSAEDEER